MNGIYDLLHRNRFLLPVPSSIIPGLRGRFFCLHLPAEWSNSRLQRIGGLLYSNQQLANSKRNRAGAIAQRHPDVKLVCNPAIWRDDPTQPAATAAGTNHRVSLYGCLTCPHWRTTQSSNHNIIKPPNIPVLCPNLMLKHQPPPGENTPHRVGTPSEVFPTLPYNRSTL